MKKVDMLFTEDSGDQVVLFTVGLHKGRAYVVRGDKKAARAYGVPVEPIRGLGGREVSRDDGLEYLETLKIQYSGSRLRATDVYE